jgi:hypothetical protein
MRRNKSSSGTSRWKDGRVQQKWFWRGALTFVRKILFEKFAPGKNNCLHQSNLRIILFYKIALWKISPFVTVISEKFCSICFRQNIFESV